MTVLQKSLMEPLFTWSRNQVVFLVILYSVDYCNTIPCAFCSYADMALCTGIIKLSYIAT